MRPPQARYSFWTRRRASAYVSLENPDSSIDFSITGKPVTPTTPAPDITLRFQKRMGTRTSPAGECLSRPKSAVAGWDAQVDLWMGRERHWRDRGHGRDTIVLGVAYGHGIARYVGDTAGAESDAAPEADDRFCLWKQCAPGSVWQLSAVLEPKYAFERDALVT